MLHKAIRGIGTDEAVVVEHLTHRTNEEMAAIKEAYVKVGIGTGCSSDHVLVVILWYRCSLAGAWMLLDAAASPAQRSLHLLRSRQGLDALVNQHRN